MPKSAKKKKAPGPELPFEEALGRLETLVQGMESDQVPLEELIKNYEEGTQLYQICEQRLDEANGRIEMIRKKKSGLVKIEPFEEKESAPDTKPAKGVKSSTEKTDPESAKDGELF